MQVLVTGGTGFLGGCTVRALLERGERVRVLARNAAAATALSEAGAEIWPGDLTDARSVVSACAGMDAVVHAGALSAPWGPPAEFHAVNVGGTEHVLLGCRAHRVARLVHISSPSVVFDGRDQVEATESAPYPRRFSSVYSLTKKLAEDRVREARDVSSVILRPKALFGPGDTSLVPRLLAAARTGRLPQIGDGGNLVDLTYVENAAHAILLALDSSVSGRTYTITNGEPVPLWEVVRRVLRHARLDPDLRPLPVPVAHAAALLMEAGGRITGREPLLTRYSVAILARTQTYDISAARRDLGYEPVVSLEEGIRRTLAALEPGRG